ncbi:unnamed protein product, partial [Closterium sp. NIES-53]
MGALCGVDWKEAKVDMLQVFGCMCMALVPKHLRHNKLGAKAIWAVHMGMAQNSKGWLLWDPFTKKFLVRRDCKFMENLMYKDWKAENEAKIGVWLGEVKGSGLEHMELPLELSSSSTITRLSPQANGGEGAKDGKEEGEEVQQASERAPILPPRITSVPRIRVTPQQCHESIQLPEGCKAITSKWIFTIKTDADSNIERYKSRLVAKGYQQNEKVDFKGVFTPVCVKGPEEESVGEEERGRFHSLVGSLMYAAVNTQPDVAFAIGQLARVVICPNEEQVAARMRVAKYLGQTKTVGLQHSAVAQRRQKGADGVQPGRLFLAAFSDASYSSETEDMKSLGGFIFYVGGGPTAWKSQKQVDQALLSVESEYMALFRAIREVVWQRRLLAELGEEQQGPGPIYCDSQGTIAHAKNHVLHGLTKHMK